MHLSIFLPGWTHSNKWADDQKQATSNFGLITRPYDTDNVFDPEHQKTQWERLAHQVRTLNQSSDENVSYKLLFLGRHGEGNHNVAERRYGTAAWDVRPSSPPTTQVPETNRRYN